MPIDMVFEKEKWSCSGLLKCIDSRATIAKSEAANGVPRSSNPVHSCRLLCFLLHVVAFLVRFAPMSFILGQHMSLFGI